MGDERSMQPDSQRFSPEGSSEGAGPELEAQSATGRTSRLRLWVLLAVLAVSAIFVWYVVGYRRSVAYQAGQLKNPNLLVRIQAMRNLSDMKEKARRVFPAIVEALGDREVPVRSQAAMIIREIGPREARSVPLLLAVVQRSDLPVEGRTMAVNLLPEMSEAAAQAVPVLIGVARSSEDVRLRQAALLAAHRIAPDDAGLLDAVFEIFGDPDDAVRGAAIGIAAQEARGGGNVFLRVTEQFRSDDARRRLSAVLTFRTLGALTDRVLPVLVQGVADRNKEVREAAIVSLVGAANSRQALQEIRKAAATLDPSARSALEEKLAEAEKRLEQ